MFNKIAQFALPVFTIGGMLLISLKLPAWGIIVSLLAQPIWLYSSWKAYKKAGQLGMFINAMIMLVVLSFGFINYFFVK